ncbi:hypothetical protein ACOMHN_061466 [Nucella lapillus]
MRTSTGSSDGVCAADWRCSHAPTRCQTFGLFFLFMPEHFFQTAATEANNYAKQKITDKGLATDPLWTDTTPEEIRAYMATLIMMGIKRLPRIHLYWSTDRWWRYIFNSMMNLCVVQAFITWEKSPHDTPVRKRYDHMSFRYDIVDRWRAGFSSRKRAASKRTPATQPPIYYQTIDQHKLVRREGCKRVCRQCVIAGRCTAKNGRVETSYMGQFCQVSLCHHQRDCFRDYHQQNLVGQPRQQENNL